jgi:hypothetical protein
MVEKRSFRIVLVGVGHGVGEGVTATIDKENAYEGKEVKIRLR